MRLRGLSGIGSPTPGPGFVCWLKERRYRGEGQTMRSILVFPFSGRIGKTGPSQPHSPRAHRDRGGSVPVDSRRLLLCATFSVARALMSRGGPPRHYAYIRKRRSRQRSIGSRGPGGIGFRGARLDRSAATVVRGRLAIRPPYREMAG